MSTATTFQRATRKDTKLRMAINGPSGSGKTWTALAIAQGLGEAIALIDTERGSASKYADTFAFDVLELDTFHPDQYIKAIVAAHNAGYDVLIIDSLSHAWAGKDGALELVDRAAKKAQSQNTFAAWRDVTPLHNKLVDTMLRLPMHLIVTMRTKTSYIMEQDDRTKKTTVRKVGLAPIQRDGVEYEFDVVGDLTLDHTFVISKTRFAWLDNQAYDRPDSSLGVRLKEDLTGDTPAHATQFAAQRQFEQTKEELYGTEKPTSADDAAQALHNDVFDAILKINKARGYGQKQFALWLDQNGLPALADTTTAQREAILAHLTAHAVGALAKLLTCFHSDDDGTTPPDDDGQEALIPDSVPDKAKETA